MRIGIISDGKYGDRAFENIKQMFDTKWILVPDISLTSMLDDDIALDIPDCDLFISYVRHPDIILQIVGLQKPTILAILPGLGLLQQAQEINPRVIGTKTMCSLDPETGVQEIDEFAEFVGRPKFAVMVAPNGLVENAMACRTSPCGSSMAGASFLKGQRLTSETLQEFALSICHECRAPRFGHTCDKEVSGLIHITALLDDIPEIKLRIINPELLLFKAKIQDELKKRMNQ
jgi:hypothetical protein